MQTKTRGHQIRPTKAEVNSAWVRLRTAADQGDIQAAALLVALAENRPLLSAPTGARA
ncbi:MAG: hypothetical protein ACK4TD_18585 [Ectopseudomonas guguanensis]|uniref:hypothetical protein n=1 Tax=Ectopseudomonas guguanensis TaxID=1198456 RepID=UPI00391D770A